jgi:hypothetical protein
MASVRQALGLGGPGGQEQQQQQQEQQQRQRQEASMEDEWVRSYEQRESARNWYEQQQDTYRTRSRYSSSAGQQQSQRTTGAGGGSRTSGPGTSPPDNGGFPPGYDHYQVLGVKRDATLLDIQVGAGAPQS